MSEERLQDCLPEEKATYYIVKDYQRMYEEVEKSKAMMRKAAVHIGKVMQKYEFMKQENEKMKKRYDRVLNASEIDKLNRKYEKMVTKRDKWKVKYEELSLQVAQGKIGFISRLFIKLGL